MRWSTVVLVSMLSGCTVVPGPEVGVKEVMKPPVLDTPAPLPAPAVPSVQAPGAIGVWVPRKVQPNGDVVEGHYRFVSEQAPREESLEPDRILPLAPRPSYQPKKAAPKVQVPVDQFPLAPPPLSDGTAPLPPSALGGGVPPWSGLPTGHGVPVMLPPQGAP